MKVSDVMTKNCICTGPNASLQAVAALMVDIDCGALPVVGNIAERKNLVGMITDRDIACRAVARGKGPETPVGEVISNRVVTVAPDDDLQTARHVMQNHKIRRVPVVSGDGVVEGMLSSAQVIRESSEEDAGEYIKAVSEKTMESALT